MKYNKQTNKQYMKNTIQHSTGIVEHARCGTCPSKCIEQEASQEAMVDGIHLAVWGVSVRRPCMYVGV